MKAAFSLPTTMVCPTELCCECQVFILPRARWRLGNVADTSRYHIQSIFSVEATPVLAPLQRMVAVNHVGGFASPSFLVLHSMFANRNAREMLCFVKH